MSVKDKGRMQIPVQYFPVIEGSMTNEHGGPFFLKVCRSDGKEFVLGFPQAQLPTLLRSAASQLSKSGCENDETAVVAFKPTSFEVGRGSDGKSILSMIMGDTGTITFLLAREIREQLILALANTLTHH